MGDTCASLLSTLLANCTILFFKFYLRLITVFPDILDYADVLHKLYHEVSETLSVREVARYMYKNYKLTAEELQSIQSNHGKPIAAAKVLLDVVVCKPRDVYDCFLNALTETNQQCIRELIETKNYEGTRPQFIYTVSQNTGAHNWYDITSPIRRFTKYFGSINVMFILRTLSYRLRSAVYSVRDNYWTA